MKQLAKRSVQLIRIAIVIAILSFGYQWGKRSAHQGSAGDGFRVTGDSMSPTLSAESQCEVQAATRPLRIGDVVAIDWNGQRRVKRIAALAGDTVDLADGRLLVNGGRLEDWLAARVDPDWLPPASVPVSTNTEPWSRVSVGHDWLVYAHRNPHQGGRLTPVMDDYTINDSVRRILNPVDHLMLQLHATDSGVISNRLVAFYVNERLGFTTTTGDGIARSRDAQPPDTLQAAESELAGSLAESLNASHPIAIKLAAQDDGGFSKHVLREIEYRDDKPSGAVDYPVTLEANQIFVVGDNVPVSVDSRHFGPVDRSAVIGVVIP